MRGAMNAERLDTHGKPLVGRELTPSEVDVLTLIANGYTNQEAADSLGKALGTIEQHVYQAIGKLEAENRTNAVYIAVKRGVI